MSGKQTLSKVRRAQKARSTDRRDREAIDRLIADPPKQNSIAWAFAHARPLR